MDRLERALRVVEDVFVWAAILVLVFISGLVCIEVVLRYGFNAPLMGMIQISEIGLLYITFLGTAWVLRTDQHVRIELVYQFLPPVWRTRMDVISSLVGLVICSVLVVFGCLATWSHYVRGAYKPTLLEVPNWVILIIIPIGSIPLALRYLVQLVFFLRGGRRELQQY